MVELENGKRLEYPTTYDESVNDKDHDFSKSWNTVLVLGFIVLAGALAISSEGAFILGVLLLFSAWYLQGRCIAKETKVKELQEFIEHQTINGIKARVVPHPEHTH
ncbi:MAG: hypothetical protein NTX14_01430 [Candidatus Nealsonbacteria bacterium]|nr:hypothetical protein [Candidatus Nealsonbacteria bacterium]